MNGERTCCHVVFTGRMSFTVRWFYYPSEPQFGCIGIQTLRRISNPSSDYKSNNRELRSMGYILGCCSTYRYPSFRHYSKNNTDLPGIQLDLPSSRTSTAFA